MSREAEALAILFADITGSTKLYEVLGDEDAQGLISATLSLLSGIALQHGGSVIKTIGDEILCTFPTISDAVDAAEAMSRALDHRPVSRKLSSPVHIHAGIHMGPVVQEDGDVFGDAVNVAARLTELAKERQILITDEILGELCPAEEYPVRYVDRTLIKGRLKEVCIYEILWEKDDMTAVADPSIITSITQKILPAQVELRSSGQVVRVNHVFPVARIGRSAQNDLVIDSTVASRTHALVEYRKGRFVLVDQSSNGTYLQIEGRECQFLRREEAPLEGTGIIGLGRNPPPDDVEAIHFVVKVEKSHHSSAGGGSSAPAP